LVLLVTIDKKIDQQQCQELKTDQGCPDSVAIFPVQKGTNARKQDAGEAEAFVKCKQEPDSPHELQREDFVY
jgi:hypothetical protein